MTNEKKIYQSLRDDIERIQEKHNLKDYTAFVFWFIETSYGLGHQEILSSICDKANDKGIDAIVIDHIETTVRVIQSKYEQEGNKAQINRSDINNFSQVREYFSNQKSSDTILKNVNEQAKRLIKEAFDLIKKRKYSLELIFITTHRENPEIEPYIRNTLQLRVYELEILSYKNMIQLQLDKERDFTPALPSYNLPFKSEHSFQYLRKEEFKSIVVSVKLSELKSMVAKFGDKLYRKNVRLFLGTNKVNRAIVNTIKKMPQFFWFFNNGITILCDSLSVELDNAYIRIKNPQIVNGCQTTKSVAEHSESDDKDSFVLVRIIECNDYEMINYITLYQNSSNKVTQRDFKSNDPVQIRLKHILREYKYFYETKRGDTLTNLRKQDRQYDVIYKNGSINNEDVAKLLGAIKFNPSEALSKTEEWFDDYYDDIFNDNTSANNCLAIILLYELVKDNRIVTDTQYLDIKGTQFHKRASYHLVRYFYDILGDKNKWEKQFIKKYFDDERYDNEEKYRKNIDKFEKSIQKVSKQLLKIVYREYKISETDNINAYLQRVNTYQELKSAFNANTNAKKYKKDIKETFDSIFNIK